MIDPRCWDVPCPVCGVPAGASCRNALGEVLHVVHLLRMFDAQDKAVGLHGQPDGIDHDEP